MVWRMVAGPNGTEQREALGLELRRGVLVLAVLSHLREEQYGYSLKKALGARGLEIDEGTLYPLMRRLEGQGLLRSRWRVEEGRPRRYYRTSAQGEQVLKGLEADWQQLSRAMERVLK
jgi:PadR family transcriptional regulator, regulatory protein PadR